MSKQGPESIGSFPFSPSKGKDRPEDIPTMIIPLSGIGIERKEKKMNPIPSQPVVKLTSQREKGKIATLLLRISPEEDREKFIIALFLRRATKVAPTPRGRLAFPEKRVEGRESFGDTDGIAFLCLSKVSGDTHGSPPLAFFHLH